ncbi:hypothetical protein ES707_03857 [subsurface metagenome]
MADIVLVYCTNELNIQMVPVAGPPGLANLSGRVTDAETGSPIAGMVGIYAGRIITTDADGVYSLTGLTPGSYTIKFDVLDYETLIADLAVVEGNNEFNAELVPVLLPEFTGFSLLLANYPPGTAHWLADFPYMGYPEKITMRPIGEAGWITADAPGTDTIRIILLDANYQCIDPTCERTYTFFFRDGYHYLLDLATGELGRNPNPPPPEIPVEEPAIVGVDIPSVQSGEEFTPTILAYLPEVNPGLTYWLLIVEARPVKGVITVARGQFISPALAGIHGWIPLSSPDGKYTLTGICTGAGCEPAKAVSRWYQVGWRTEPAPPGSYPVTAIAMLYAVVSADPSGIGLTQVGSYDLGVVGVLEVT